MQNENNIPSPDDANNADANSAPPAIDAGSNSPERAPDDAPNPAPNTSSTDPVVEPEVGKDEVGKTETQGQSPTSTDLPEIHTLRGMLVCSTPGCQCHLDDGYVHCPAHKGTIPRLYLFLEDGKICFGKCHEGCTPDEVGKAMARVIAGKAHQAQKTAPDGPQIEPASQSSNSSEDNLVSLPDFTPTPEQMQKLPPGMSYDCFNNPDYISTGRVAALLALTKRPDAAEWYGPNPFGEDKGATDDGFILFAAGNAHDRKVKKSYSCEEMRVLAKKVESEGGPNALALTSSPKPKAPHFDWDSATKYRYYDRNLILLLEVGRIDGPNGKQIRQRKPNEKVRFDGQHPELGCEDYTYNTQGVPRVLYNLPLVLKADTVFFCEGEKAVDALNRWIQSQRKLGECVATTTLGGAGQSHHTDFDRDLMRKKVIILPDNDAPGAQYASDLYVPCSLASESVEIYELPGLPERGDVVDYLEAHAKSGERPTELLELIGATEWIPPTPPTTEATTTETIAPEAEGSEESLPEAASESFAEQVPSPDPADSPLATVRPPISEGKVEAPLTSPPNASVTSAVPKASVVPLEEAPAPSKRELRGDFHFHRLNDVMGWEEPGWLIEQFLTLGGTSMVTAKHASFKSFLCMDMALCVATGRAFHGIEVQKGSVVYIAAEGASGLKSRALAWSVHHKTPLPDNFYILNVPFELTNPEILDSFIREVSELEPSLILLDTLARCAVGLEENSSKDMGQFSGAVIRLAQTTGAHVLTIHHSAKKGDYRGSSSLPAAVDTHLSLERSKDTVTLTVEKQREAKESTPMKFKTLDILIGQDEDQRESIVFELQDTLPEDLSFSVSRLSTVEKSVLQELSAAFAPEGASTNQLGKACQDVGIEERTYRRTRNKLIELGAITVKTKEGKQVSNSEFAGFKSQESKTCLYSVNYDCEWCEFLLQGEESDDSTED